MSGGERLAQLFAEAEALPPADRASLVAALRAEDGDLAEDLASLLAASSVVGSLIDGSPWQALGEEPPDELRSVPAAIGPYRIVRPLGSGGMGSVFLAHQRGDGFERQVAIKVLDRPAAGEARLRRFREEARILAGLEHPNIARFYDAGRGEDGGLYLVLEYVEGRDLLTHVRAAGLGLRQRVELFLQVVDAVAFAHRRLVVHRDLKPGNVLVDADGRARLLDFGISKILDDENSGEATRTDFRALTPAYASPEQLRGERAGAASDVYSLGVMLYELLAGERPFAATADPAAFVRAVLEDDPDAPSTAARRAATTGSRRNASHEATTATAGQPRVDRDLDAICLKALRREPADRYASAAELADDLRRHLDGRPVAARRGGRRYRLAKLLQRRRAWLATAAALTVAVAALVVAVEARWRVERAARPAPPPEPRPFPFSKIPAVPIEQLEKGFAAAPDNVEAGAGLAIGLVYADRLDEAALVLARMRQVPGREHDPLCDYVDGSISQHRDQPQRALVLFTRARDGALSTGRGELVGRTRASRGRMLAILGQHAEGEREMELALADFEGAGDALPAAQVLNNLAIESLQRGDYVRGEKRLERSLARFREAGSEGAVVLRNLAEVSLRRGRPDAAERWARESIRIAKLERPQQRRRLWVLGEAMAEQGRAAEATAILDEAIGYMRDAGDWPELAYALLVRGRVEVGAGRLDQVGALVHELEDAARSSGDRVTLTAAKLLRGWQAAARGDADAARRELAEARRLQLEENEPVLAALTNVDRALVELAADDREAALRILDDPSTDAGIGSSAGVLAEVLRFRIDAESGRLDAARRRLAALGDADAAAPDLRRRLAFLRARAALAAGEGRLDDARRDLAAAIAAAAAAERRVDELRLRLDLGALELAADDRSAARAVVDGAGEEAARRGLTGIAARARSLAEASAANVGASR
jgi:eukaryotic-like serine/threonine-protein kinase